MTLLFCSTGRELSLKPLVVNVSVYGFALLTSILGIFINFISNVNKSYSHQLQRQVCFSVAHISYNIDLVLKMFKKKI